MQHAEAQVSRVWTGVRDSTNGAYRLSECTPVEVSDSTMCSVLLGDDGLVRVIEFYGPRGFRRYYSDTNAEVAYGLLALISKGLRLLK
jgi:hypothetical protein